LDALGRARATRCLPVSPRMLLSRRLGTPKTERSIHKRSVGVGGPSRRPPMRFIVRVRYCITQDLSAHLRLSAVGPCSQQDRTSICSLRPAGRRRRLSLCSLPVPKHREGSLGSRLRRPGRFMQDLAACASIIPIVLSSEKRYATALSAILSKTMKSCCRRSTASM